MRFQHQSTEVQIADIMTKDLGKNLHRRHRKVLFGDAPIEIKSVPLPDSHKVYVRRHNEELAQRTKTAELKKALELKSGSSSHSALLSVLRLVLQELA